MSATIKTLPADASKADTAGYAKALQVKTTAGKLLTLRAHNKGATCYLQFHEAVAAPAEAAVPARAPIELPTGYYESDTPFDFAAGLYVCGSSTAATKTLLATDDLWITATYN